MKLLGATTLAFVIFFGSFTTILATHENGAVHGPGSGTLNPGGGAPGSGTFTPPSNTDTGNDFSLNVVIDNPLKTEIDTLPEFIEEILRIVLKIGVPIIVLAIIYSGLLFVMAMGNPEKLKQAKDTLLYVLIGGAILLGAWVIAEAIQGTLTKLGA